MSNKLKLNGATIEMRMSIKPSTTASQKSSKSSYIEMSFNANVDHYLCYQWTKAIEVNPKYHNTESDTNKIRYRYISKLDGDVLFESQWSISMETFIYCQKFQTRKDG